MLLSTPQRLSHARQRRFAYFDRLAPSESQMLPSLQSAVAIPVRALAWLGGQGTRAIAALVFIGVAVPPVGDLLKPFVTEAIFLLLCISFMRVDIGALRAYLRRPRIVVAATAWTMLGVPLISGEAVSWPGSICVRRISSWR